MKKLFSTKTHGVLDYVTAGQLMMLPRMLGWSDSVTSFMTSMGLGTVGYSLLTRYEYGPFKVLPMTAHLAIDAMNGALFCAAPVLFPKESSTVKATLVGLGLFEFMAALTTETEPSYGEQASQFVADARDSVSDAVEMLRERAVGS